jgi:hypothetical protein
MSKKPHPIACTAIILSERNDARRTDRLSLFDVANLASQLHRLAPACKRQAVALSNGELWNGQRREAGKDATRLAEIYQALEARGARLASRIRSLNRELAGLCVKACTSAKGESDPRGPGLWLEPTRVGVVLPRNGFHDDRWVIE